MIERHEIKDRESWHRLRGRDVTASVVGCLLGVHEYMTPYALWALKTGIITDDPEETAPMRRGRLLEPVALQLLREEHPDWQIAEPKTYYRDTEARLGGTPDAIAVRPDREGTGVIQIKTVEPGVYRKKWFPEGSDHAEPEPPLWIAVQAITEAYLTGASWAVVAPMRVSFGVDISVIDVPIDQTVITRIKAEVAAFWAMIDAEKKPDPDWRRDAKLMEELYMSSGTVDLSSDNQLVELADERATLAAQGTAAEKRKKEIKAEILHKMGGAALARIADGRVLSAKRIFKKGHVVEPHDYIDLRVNKGEK